ncbi:hypothetical protein BGZ61DRAFT_307043, partial [Ilyonectria robusta]|uniref:uncharacterized protein n=1 Tax=Ilyonectria robusta TaxID=1079257 RepID=UPI001E8D0163
HHDILGEINGRIHCAVEGFFEKYFQCQLWPGSAEIVAQAAAETAPKLSPHSPLGDIFLDTQSDFPAKRSIFLSYPPRTPGHSGQHISQLFLVPSGSGREATDYTWADVQVIGQLQEHDGSDYPQGLLRLCEHAREVFTSQPTRLFLHGFLIFGSTLELWVFDSAGLYSCKPFDARKNSDRLVAIVTGYLRMTDRELGINTIIEKGDDGGNYITFRADEELEPSRLCLEQEPIAFPRRLVSQAPICYKAKRPDSEGWEFVVKFSWRSEARSSEEEVLRLVKRRKVWGVVQIFGHQEVDTITNLRQGLRFGVPREFRPATTTTRESAPPMLTSAGAGECHGVIAYTEEVAPTGLERVRHGTHSPFDTRTLGCLVVSPLGHPLDKFHHVLECIEACRDAVKAHRSLYLDGKILHQDISKDNTIIRDRVVEGGPRGILIDLVAPDSYGKTTGPRNPEELIGTKAFMAIDLLQRKPHTYRHDLESFLYVFLWIAICGGHKRLPSKSRLQRWQAGSFQDAAQSKVEDVAEENFRAIVSEFSPAFKGLEGLAWNLRDILF